MENYIELKKVNTHPKEGCDCIKLFNFNLVNDGGNFEVVVENSNNSYHRSLFVISCNIASSINNCTIEIRSLISNFIINDNWISNLFEKTFFLAIDENNKPGFYISTGWYFSGNACNTFKIKNFGRTTGDFIDIYNIIELDDVYVDNKTENSYVSSNLSDKIYAKFAPNTIFSYNGDLGLYDKKGNYIYLRPTYEFNSKADIPFANNWIDINCSFIILKSNKELGYTAGNICRAYDGEEIEIKRSGTTSERPTPSKVGFIYFDTSLGTSGKPIWYAGKDGNDQDVWVDATGTTV